MMTNELFKGLEDIKRVIRLTSLKSAVAKMKNVEPFTGGTVLNDKTFVVYVNPEIKDKETIKYLYMFMAYSFVTEINKLNNGGIVKGKTVNFAGLKIICDDNTKSLKKTMQLLLEHTDINVAIDTFINEKEYTKVLDAFDYGKFSSEGLKINKVKNNKPKPKKVRNKDAINVASDEDEEIAKELDIVFESYMEHMKDNVSDEDFALLPFGKGDYALVHEMKGIIKYTTVIIHDETQENGVNFYYSVDIDPMKTIKDMVIQGLIKNGSKISIIHSK